MDEQQHVTFREFDGFKDAVVNAISDAAQTTTNQFHAMERRFADQQKTTNELLRIAGEHQTQLKEHERRLNSGLHRHIRKDDPAPSPDSEPLTMKDLKRAAWVAAAVIAVAVAGVVVFVSSLKDKL